MQYYINDFANDLLSRIPDTEDNRCIRGRIKSAVQLCKCGHFTELEASFVIHGIIMNYINKEELPCLTSSTPSTFIPISTTLF